MSPEKELQPADGLRVRDEGSGRQVSAPSRASRAVRPGSCTNCEAPAPAGGRFCTSCGFYLPSPEVGRLASAQRRLGAFILDEVIKNGGLIGSVLWPAVLPGSGRAVVAILSALYWVSSLRLWTRGTTPAKRLLQMTVITEDGEPAGFFRMAFRETIGKMLSMMVVGLGMLSIPIDREKRGWHDKIFGTWVVHEDEP